MAAEILDAEVRRDTALEKRMLEAVIADRNAQPRNQQIQVGPSEVGGCRELLRAGLFEPETLSEPETHWATAAHVGSVMGESLEAIFGRRLSALEQQRVTATFNRLGVSISGAIDLLFINEAVAEGEADQVTDLKSTNDIGGVLYDLKKNASAIETLLAIWREGLLFQKNIETADGGYELTEKMVSQVSKLHYYVQVAIYVSGAIELGIMRPNAEGRLVFYDRSGSYQEFVALIITNEELQLFYEIGQHRLEQVVAGQVAYENGGGNPAIIAHLRDMTPSYCFSPKVMCPRRMHCWGGSDWTADERISPEHAQAVERYIIGRDMAKLGDGMKRAARDDLKGISGVLPDGRMVTWVRGGSTINIVETTAQEPKAMHEVLDEALAKMHVEPEEPTPDEKREARRRALKAMRKPSLTLIASDEEHQLSTDGTVSDLIERILAHEFPTEAVADTGVDFGATLEGQGAAEPAETLEQTMIWIGDVSFRCECGSNVFTKRGEHEYTCNGCGARYDDGERNDPEAPEPELETLAPNGEMLPAEHESDDTAAVPDEATEQPLEQSNAAQQYETADALRRRQALFGLNPGELQQEACSVGADPELNRSAMIQAIIDAEFQPAAGRGWLPNGIGTTGDASTDRLRQMQYDADPAYRSMKEQGADG